MFNNELTFRNIIGQSKAKRLLQKSYASGKLSHAYLFKGPDGVGKKRTALTLAASINCLNPKNQDACGQCSSCRKYLSGNHPDLLNIQPEGAMIKISQIRALKHDLTYAPFEGNYRVVILENVQTMRHEAENSLLKTLEEPPADNILILIANETGELLPTIISRCQLIPFHLLPQDQVANILIEEDSLAEEEAKILAAVSEGSLGRARMIQKKDLLNFRKEVIEILLKLQADTPETIATVYQVAEKAAGLKEHLYDLLDLLKIWFRDLILLRSGGQEETVINRDLIPFMSNALQRWKKHDLFEKVLLVNDAEKKLMRNCNRSLVCEVLLLNLI